MEPQPPTNKQNALIYVERLSQSLSKLCDTRELYMQCECLVQQAHIIRSAHSTSYAVHTARTFRDRDATCVGQRVVAFGTERGNEVTQ